MLIIANFPIIHKGYLDILNKYPTADIFVLSEELAKPLYPFEIDLRKINPLEIKKMFSNIGQKIEVLTDENLNDIYLTDQIIIIKDDVMENFQKKYLADFKNIILENGFFYQKTENVFSTEEKKENENKNYTEKDLEYMKQALALAKQSGCFWRQVASIVVKDEKIIFQNYNKMLPNNDECYKIDCIRDNLKPGEKTAELCSAVHSEASCIAVAAKQGISLLGASIYVTVFPCGMCAKLIALCHPERRF